MLPVSNDKLTKNTVFFHHSKGGSISTKRPGNYIMWLS